LLTESKAPQKVKMNRTSLYLIICCLIGLRGLIDPASLSAQTPAKPKTPVSTVAARETSDSKADADRLDKERRAQARALLISLASDARSFRDQMLRARSLARIADVLWNADTDQGRTLFRKAWEAANIADRESHEHIILGQWPPNLRVEVLKLTARHDRQLAEEFLQKLKADEQERKSDDSNSNLWGLPEALEQRLRLAQEMLGAGDVERALQFADPVLNAVTMSTLEFLTNLREKDPAAADQRYAAVLGSAAANMQTDANTISLLSSYIFTPHLYVPFTEEGRSQASWMRTLSPPANVDPQLRLAFFQTAASVLLRPEQPEQGASAAGVVSKYMVVKRLMPLFEQYAPKEIAVSMRGQFEALSAMVNDGVRQQKDDWLEKGIAPEKSAADEDQPVQEQIEHAKTSGERDELYFKLALRAIDKDDMKARDYVAKIEESEFRKQAQAWVDASLAFGAIRKKKAKTALELLRIGELTHIQRVWILTQAAQLLAKTDRDQALSLLDEASAEVRRLDGSGSDRPRALLAIANALKLVEPARVWDAVYDSIKAANSTDGFTGEDGGLSMQVASKAVIITRMEQAVDFDIAGIFSQMAKDDYERAVELARGYQAEAPRAVATVAIARAVLETKKTTPEKPAAKAN
jgi:hypothetical protein